MTDGGDDRDARGGDGACHAFVVEGPELFGETPATADDHHVDVVSLVQEADPPDDASRSPFPLHLGGSEEDVHVRKASPQHAEDIADGGAGRRGDHPDRARQEGKGPLAGGIEEPLFLELLLELLESEVERSRPAG